MKNAIKDFLRPILPQAVLNVSHKLFSEKELKKQIAEWEKNGCPAPPPHIIKQRTITEYQHKSGLALLVETGTFRGDMVQAQKNNFKKIISIELGMDLFLKAQKKFKKDKHITIVQGDSGEVLPKIIKDIHEPAIFWLDGHYSAGVTAKGAKDCPIFEELDAIFNGNTSYEHIFLIDDARCFTGEGDYPTIEKLTEYIKSKNEKYRVEVKYDIIRYVI